MEKIKTSKALEKLFHDLQAKAYDNNFHYYQYKETNQIIRQHFEKLEKANLKIQEI